MEAWKAVHRMPYGARTPSHMIERIGGVAVGYGLVTFR